MKTLSFFFLRRALSLSFGRAAFASFVRCRRFPPPPPLLSIEGGGARGEREGERPKKRGERGLQPPLASAAVGRASSLIYALFFSRAARPFPLERKGESLLLLLLLFRPPPTLFPASAQCTASSWPDTRDKGEGLKRRQDRTGRTSPTQSLRLRLLPPPKVGNRVDKVKGEEGGEGMELRTGHAITSVHSQASFV